MKILDRIFGRKRCTKFSNEHEMFDDCYLPLSLKHDGIAINATLNINSSLRRSRHFLTWIYNPMKIKFNPLLVNSRLYKDNVCKRYGSFRTFEMFNNLNRLVQFHLDNY